MNGHNHTLSEAPQRLYTIGEEIVHSITHGVGAALSLVGLTLLVVLAVLRGDHWQVISFSIYGCTLFLLYLASTLYHSFQNPRIKKIFQKMDHSAIYLLIAGTYTPFLLISLRGAWGWTLLVVVWGIAILGIGFKTLFLERFMKLSILGYVLMGWLCVIAGKQVLTNIPQPALLWLAVGGAFYTGGIIFLAWRRIPYNHAIWHMFVLGGSICHFVAVFQLLPAV